MATRNIDIDVRLKGGIFRKAITPTVQRAIVSEILDKVEDRTKRQGRGLGAQRNQPITFTRVPHRLQTTVRAPVGKFPRTTGRAWPRKNVAIVKSMAPRVANKTATRIAAEMGGA